MAGRIHRGTLGIPVGLLVTRRLLRAHGPLRARANTDYDPLTRQIIEKVEHRHAMSLKEGEPAPKGGHKIYCRGAGKARICEGVSRRLVPPVSYWLLRRSVWEIEDRSTPVMGGDGAEEIDWCDEHRPSWTAACRCPLSWIHRLPEWARKDPSPTAIPGRYRRPSTIRPLARGRGRQIKYVPFSHSNRGGNEDG